MGLSLDKIVESLARRHPGSTAARPARPTTTSCSIARRAFRLLTEVSLRLADLVIVPTIPGFPVDLWTTFVLQQSVEPARSPGARTLKKPKRPLRPDHAQAADDGSTTARSNACAAKRPALIPAFGFSVPKYPNAQRSPKRSERSNEWPILLAEMEGRHRRRCLKNSFPRWRRLCMALDLDAFRNLASDREGTGSLRTDAGGCRRRPRAACWSNFSSRSRSISRAPRDIRKALGKETFGLTRRRHEGCRGENAGDAFRQASMPRLRWRPPNGVGGTSSIWSGASRAPAVKSAKPAKRSPAPRGGRKKDENADAHVSAGAVRKR